MPLCVPLGAIDVTILPLLGCDCFVVISLTSVTYVAPLVVFQREIDSQVSVQAGQVSMVRDVPVPGKCVLAGRL